MSALLDDIIRLAEDGSQPLPDILRKCLRLGHELKNDRLKMWAMQELNGYDCDIEDLPTYRIIPAPAYGYFASKFHQAPHYIIPPAVLEEVHRDCAILVYLADAVSTYADLAKTSTSGRVTFPWPANIVGYYQNKLWQGMPLHSAWQEIPTNVLVGMLDVIRNLTMKLALEIKDELGTPYDLNRIKPEAVERVNGIVINNLGGNVALGDVDASGSTIIVAGDRKALDAALIKAGMNQTDLNELTEAIQADGKKKGSQVTKWIGDKAQKMLIGGVKMTATIAQQVLTEMLMRHYGLKA
jgi:hypothetical protein